jgi:hypothetical protein
MTKMHQKRKARATKKLLPPIQMHILGGSNKKPRQPNWEHGEFLTLMKVKRDEHIATLAKIDP